MKETDPLKIETDEDRLRVCLDVVIPMMREMAMVEPYMEPKPGHGPQVWFSMWHDGVSDYPTEQCGCFGCLGGWYERVTGENWEFLKGAWRNISATDTDICSAIHHFSNKNKTREELEARAAAIAKVLGR